MINLILGVIMLVSISTLNLEYVAWWLVVQGTLTVLQAACYDTKRTLRGSLRDS